MIAKSGLLGAPKFKSALVALVTVAFIGAVGSQDATAQNGNRGNSNHFLNVIVVLDDSFASADHDSNIAQASGIALSLGADPEHVYGSAVFGFAGRIPEGRLAALENDPRVSYVSLVRPVSIPRTAAAPDCSDPNSTHPKCNKDDGGDDNSGSQSTPWGVERIGAASSTGDGVDVFIFDTGIDSDHEDLVANLAASHHYVAPGLDCSGCAQAWDDDNSHGTHVAGTVAAADNGLGVVGVAPGAILHAVKILGGNGSGSDAGVIAAIDWLTSLLNNGNVVGPVVANMSFETQGVSKTGTCSGSGFVGTDAYHEAICNAAIAGVVVVAAAGNGASVGPFGGANDAANIVPAAYDDAVITVTATERSKVRGQTVDDWPNWSNYGNDSASWTSNNSAPVAIAAPGGKVNSTLNNGGYGDKDGTSMAAPHVAGAVALYLANGVISSNYSAFTSARGTLLTNAEETAGSFSNTSGYPHAEDFLDVGGF